MRKICFMGFDPFSVSGCQKVTVSLANNLCENYDVSVVSFCKIPDKIDYFIDTRVKRYSYGMPSDLRIRKSLKLVFKIKRFIDENKIDVLFVVGLLPAPVITVLRPFLKSKVVFCEHENISGRDKKTVFFKRLACKMSDKVVVLTKQTLEDYLQKTNVSSKKITHIYNYVDDELLQKNIVCDVNSKKIISVGRLSEEKGFEIAIDVASEVFKKYPDWQWNIYGDGPDREKLNNKIKNMNLENNFFLKGYASDVVEKYREHSIFVLTSQREGFALVLVEAKASALPVVSFNCSSGPSEIVRDGIDGYLVPCYDKNYMVEKICNLIENSELRQNFSNNAKGNIENFSKSKILKKWINLIEEIS